MFNESKEGRTQVKIYKSTLNQHQFHYPCEGNPPNGVTKFLDASKLLEFVENDTLIIGACIRENHFES